MYFKLQRALAFSISITIYKSNSNYNIFAQFAYITYIYIKRENHKLNSFPCRTFAARRSNKKETIYISCDTEQQAKTHTRKKRTNSCAAIDQYHFGGFLPRVRQYLATFYRKLCAMLTVRGRPQDINPVVFRVNLYNIYLERETCIRYIHLRIEKLYNKYNIGIPVESTHRYIRLRICVIVMAKY